MASLKTALSKYCPKTVSAAELRTQIGEFVLQELEAHADMYIEGDTFTQKELELLKSVLRIRMHVNPYQPLKVGRYASTAVADDLWDADMSCWTEEDLCGPAK
jgi:hypothetical protein